MAMDHYSSTDFLLFLGTDTSCLLILICTMTVIFYWFSSQWWERHCIQCALMGQTPLHCRCFNELP